MHTRTEGAFTLDVLAWVTSWSTPASALLGRGKDRPKGKDGRPLPTNREGGVYDRIPEHYRGLKPSRADAVRFVDLDALDRPETVGHLAGLIASAGQRPHRAKVAAFEQAVRSRAKREDVRGRPRGPQPNGRKGQ